MVLGSVTWMFFLRHATDMEVFGAAILLGAGGSTILVTSLSMTADLIGDRTVSVCNPKAKILRGIGSSSCVRVTMNWSRVGVKDRQLWSLFNSF